MEPQTSKRPPGDMESDCSESTEANPNLILKKHKLDNKVSYRTINALPNEMLVKIFKHLNVEDRLKAQRVCSRWRLILRTEPYWKYVNFPNASSSFFIGILLSLPPCAGGLRLECHGETLPISLLQVIAKINEKCSSLKFLMFEKIGFVKKVYTVTSSKTFLENALELSNQFIQTEFCNEDIVMLNAFLPELEVLSLKSVVFDPLTLPHISSSTFPRLRVLDLSYSRPLCINHILNDDGLFPTLVDLEELYLGGWLICDKSLEVFLKNAKKLRVLDVHYCSVTNRTVTVLKQNNKCLEDLCISGTKVLDFYCNIEDKEFFPHLKFLCAQDTEVIPDGLENLLMMCPLLRDIYVSNKKIHKTWCNNLTAEFKERVHFEPIRSDHCDHFRNSADYLKFHF